MADPLMDAAQRLARAYQGDPRLVAEGRGWSRSIALRADDQAAGVTFRISDGHITAVLPYVGGAASEGGAWTAGALAHDIELRAPVALLLAVLERRARPAELYLFGELLVLGSDADLNRLDYIFTRLGSP